MRPRDGSETQLGRQPTARRALLRSVGVGILLLASGVVGSAQEDDADGDEPADDEEPPPTDESVLVELVDFAYEPGTDSPLDITPGTLVEFVWITDNHNIVVDDQPDGADWDGYEPIENTGFEYDYTFEVEGEYDFHCAPHLAQGMVGTIVVDPDAAVDEEEEPLPDVVPNPAVTLLIATVVALAAVMTLVYAFLKYGSDPGP